MLLQTRSSRSSHALPAQRLLGSALGFGRMPPCRRNVCSGQGKRTWKGTSGCCRRRAPRSTRLRCTPCRRNVCSGQGKRTWKGTSGCCRRRAPRSIRLRCIHPRSMICSVVAQASSCQKSICTCCTRPSLFLVPLQPDYPCLTTMSLKNYAFWWQEERHQPSARTPQKEWRRPKSSVGISVSFHGIWKKVVKTTRNGPDLHRSHQVGDDAPRADPNIPRVVRQHADHQVDLHRLPPLCPRRRWRKKYFPVSVCCTSDYCFMDGPNTTFRYRCDNNDECFLPKENVVVQALPAPSTSAAECKATHEGKAGFPFLPEDTRKRVCNEPS